MRKIKIIIATVLLGMGFLSAQNKQLLYDFYEIPQSLLLNPGVKTPYKWHAGVPLISGIAAQAGTSGVTVNDLFANDGLSFTDKVRDRVVNGLSERDEFSANVQIDIINAGFRNPNRPEDYYSFGIYGEVSVIQYWPKDLAILAFEGNANNLNRRFDLSHIATRAEALNVFYFGINRKVNDKLRVGARAKIYSSIFEAKSTSNRGFFETTQGENNILRNTLVADVQARTSGVQELFNADDSAELTSLLLGRSFFGGNLGLGFDVGFTYQIGERTFLTGSLLDVGFISHSKDVENYTLEGTASNEGIEIILPESLDDFNNDIWQNLIDDIETQIPFETNTDSYISLRPIQLYASIRQNFGSQQQKTEDCYCGANTSVVSNSPFDYNSAIGGQLHIINRPRGPQAALTAFYQKRIGNVLAIKATYTADKFTLTNVGLGLNFQAGPINFYLIGDNLLSYRNIADSNYASLQFGFNIISWNSN